MTESSSKEQRSAVTRASERTQDSEKSTKPKNTGEITNLSELVASKNASGFPMPLLTIFIGLLSMTPPLSSDLYMPALPIMTEHLGTTQALASYTLATFFLFMGFGVLVLGPLSDMFGRKKVLLVSIICALTACTTCAFTPNIEVMLCLRALQGFGSGGMTSIATTLAKDCYSGNQMGRVIGLAQSFSMTAPVLAPLVGVAVLYAVGWRGSFLCMSVVFTISLILCLCMHETLPEDKRIKDGLSGTFRDIASFFKRPWFMLILISAAMTCMPFYDYLGIASFVYQTHFGLSEFAFGVIFACCAGICIIGPLIFARNPQKLPARRAILITISAMFVSMVIMFTVGSDFFQAFMIGVIVFMLSSSIMRPAVTTSLIAPLERGVGAASSLINFSFTIMGCVGMFIGSLDWPTPVLGMAAILGLSFLLSLCFWLISRKYAS